MPTNHFDIAIIGAGIIGLATALQIKERRPDCKIAILEKEAEVASHQTGHNSGVIHSGIYYQPGSLRAFNCQRGYYQLIDFCTKHEIPFDRCGKVIVATQEKERAQLELIFQKGLGNKMQGLRKIGPEEVAEIEPYVKSVEAIWVPQAGIVNYRKVALKYSSLLQEAGVSIFLSSEVREIKNKGKNKIILCNQREISASLLINCAGLYSDKVALLSGQKLDLRIIPFRGEYYELKKEKEYYVNNLIYPVPDLNFPFLGVHFTRMIEGGIEAGPNAVLAFRREGYSRWDFHGKEFMETITYPGFQKLAKKYWRTGMGELYRSYSKTAFVKALRHLIPQLEENDLTRGGAGVRATAIDDNGNIKDDYIILESEGIINVCNAPSPAATSSLSIGMTIAEKAIKQLEQFAL